MNVVVQVGDAVADLRDLRSFLEPLWCAWGRDNGKPVTQAGEGMCRFTAAFLSKILGKGWRFDGGHPDVFDWNQRAWVKSAAGGGFLDGNGIWQPHHWVAKGNLIVDLTASQFGEDKILVIGPDHPMRVRFRSTMDSLSRAEAMRDVERRAKAWVSLWRAQAAPILAARAASKNGSAEDLQRDGQPVEITEAERDFLEGAFAREHVARKSTADASTVGALVQKGLLREAHGRAGWVELTELGAAHLSDWSQLAEEQGDRPRS